MIVIGIFAILIWQFVESRNAVATTAVTTPLPPQRVAQIVESAFTGARSILWTNTAGPGMINKRRRGHRGGITMSIDIEPVPGGSRVDMWASQTVVYLGFIHNFAGVVNRRKRAIARLLAVGGPAAPRTGPGAPGGLPDSGRAAKLGQSAADPFDQGGSSSAREQSTPSNHPFEKQ
jgi:hypothetical protein